MWSVLGQVLQQKAPLLTPRLASLLPDSSGEWDCFYWTVESRCMWQNFWQSVYWSGDAIALSCTALSFKLRWGGKKRLRQLPISTWDSAAFLTGQSKWADRLGLEEEGDRHATVATSESALTLVHTPWMLSTGLAQLLPGTSTKSTLSLAALALGWQLQLLWV